MFFFSVSGIFLRFHYYTFEIDVARDLYLHKRTMLSSTSLFFRARKKANLQFKRFQLKIYSHHPWYMKAWNQLQPTMWLFNMNTRRSPQESYQRCFISKDSFSDRCRARIFTILLWLHENRASLWEYVIYEKISLFNACLKVFSLQFPIFSVKLCWWVRCCRFPEAAR